MNTTQGTPEWQAARERCIVTASVLPTLLGVGYTTRKDLWRQKALGVVPTFSPYVRALMDRGNRLEPEARNLFTYWYGHPVRETGFHANGARGGSPDGLVQMPDGSVECLEIKCPDKLDSVDYWNDKWLRYRIQLEMCMRYTGAQRGHLFIFHQKQGFKHWIVERDDILWRICEHEMDKFERWVQLLVEPPVHSQKEKAPFLAWVNSNGRTSMGN